jgi:SnoaL-like domain
MTTVTAESLIAFEGIRQLKARYTYLLDTKQWSEWRDLFTDDFHWETTSVEGDLVVDGADTFVEMVSSSLGQGPTVHQVHNPVLELTSPTTATGIWPMFDYVKLPEAFGQPGPVLGYGHYHETYRWSEAAGWQISTMVLSRLRVDETSAVDAQVNSRFGVLAEVTAATAAFSKRQ